MLYFHCNCKDPLLSLRASFKRERTLCYLALGSGWPSKLARLHQTAKYNAVSTCFSSIHSQLLLCSLKKEIFHRTLLPSSHLVFIALLVFLCSYQHPTSQKVIMNLVLNCFPFLGPSIDWSVEVDKSHSSKHWSKFFYCTPKVKHISGSHICVAF